MYTNSKPKLKICAEEPIKWQKEKKNNVLKINYYIIVFLNTLSASPTLLQNLL